MSRLRKLAKRAILGCHGCKKFQAKAASNPPPSGDLPVDRTQGSRAFQVIGVDYAGPTKHRKRGKMESKAYTVFYACSRLCRALYLDFVSLLETQEFILSLKFTLIMVVHLLVQLCG